MDSPLALSPSKGSALNSKIANPMSTPSKTMAGSPSKSPLKTQLGINKQATPVHINNSSSTEDVDLINWDDNEPSSPFLSVLEDKENVQSAAMASHSSTTSSVSTEVIHRELEEIGVEATPTITKHRTPFKIAEDETCTFHTSKSIRSTVTSPSRPTLSRTSTQTSYESKTLHRQVSYGTEAALDLTMNDIDDTCFSTFSEVPNTDMTAFARLGQDQSPTKQLFHGQVSKMQDKNMC
jgi:hypothetical protein